MFLQENEHMSLIYAAIDILYELSQPPTLLKNVYSKFGLYTLHQYILYALLNYALTVTSHYI